jgi:hypothetical protein
MARPKLKLDESLIERLAAIHCPLIEIAAALNVHPDTLRDRYSTLIDKGRAKGKQTLRRIQWDAAQKGNVVMMIWLGKQLLGQSDKVETENKTIVDVNVNQRAETILSEIEKSVRERRK